MCDERRFRAAIVKRVVWCAYGKNVPRDTWRNWREWSLIVSASLPGYVPGNASDRTYSYQQFCALYAIAVMRKESRESGEKRYRELSAKEIIDKSISITEELLALIEFLDKKLVMGVDAVKALKAIEGIDVSLRTVQRNVPAFSINKLYELDYLKRFVNKKSA